MKNLIISLLLLVILFSACQQKKKLVEKAQNEENRFGTALRGRLGHSSYNKDTVGYTEVTIKPYKPLEAFNGDTLHFVRTSILERKGAYIGKELNVLLQDMQIPIVKYFNSVTSGNTNITPGVYINIYSNAVQEIKKKSKINPISIYVKFASPLPSVETNKLVVKSQLNWTPEVAEYYGKQIVGDVGMVRYDFK